MVDWTTLAGDAGLTGVATWFLWNRVKDLRFRLSEVAKHVQEINGTIAAHADDISFMKGVHAGEERERKRTGFRASGAT